MIASEAAQVLDALARGIDPETGRPLSGDSLFNNPDILRALFLGANALKSQTPDRPGRAERKRSQAVVEGLAQAGKPWSKEEEDRLVEGFNIGCSVSDLAVAHERKVGGIMSRLKKLGLLKDDDELPSD